MAMVLHFRTFKEFIRSGSSGGILLLISVVISLSLANSSWHSGFERLLSTEIGFNIPDIRLKYPLLQWINEGLMSIFFLLVGLEIKREVMEGELSSVRQASLPVCAALGGAALPAMIYGLINIHTGTLNGWGIPMATDIAFALGILSLLGKKIPASLKIFLAALAIVDDLIAILVISLFYSAELHLNYLLYASVIFLLMIAFNRLKIKNLLFYMLPGLILWYCIHQSGIHATIAGVLIAVAIPAERSASGSPLEKLEQLLVNPVNFVIMPVFALANTPIRFKEDMINGLCGTVGLGILIGLLLGKPVGIILSCWLVVKLKLASLPHQAKWVHLLGIGLLGGIGFTMSVFIALLSFKELQLQTGSKFAILIASTLSALSGYLVLSTTKRDKINRLNS